MYLIERLSKQIASSTAKALNLDKDREEVIAYGALNFLHTMMTTVLLVLFGLLFGLLLEVLLIALTSAAIRKYSGGMHANSPNHCAIISLLLFGGLSLAVKYIPLFTQFVAVLVFQAIVLFSALILFAALCPVDSPNKRITNPEKRRKLRRTSIIMVLLFQALTIPLWIWYLNTGEDMALRLIACTSTGLAWQVLSITIIGRYIINKIEFLLTRMGV